MLPKRFLRKIGEHRDNPTAKEQEHDAAFIVAWREFLLIVEYMGNSEMRKTSSIPVSTTPEINRIENDGPTTSNSSKYENCVHLCCMCFNLFHFIRAPAIVSKPTKKQIKKVRAIGSAVASKSSLESVPASKSIPSLRVTTKTNRMAKKVEPIEPVYVILYFERCSQSV